VSVFSVRELAAVVEARALGEGATVLAPLATPVNVLLGGVLEPCCAYCQTPRHLGGFGCDACRALWPPLVAHLAMRLRGRAN
jgi:hypothetical protein